MSFFIFFLIFNSFSHFTLREMTAMPFNPGHMVRSALVHAPKAVGGEEDAITSWLEEMNMLPDLSSTLPDLSSPPRISQILDLSSVRGEKEH